MLLCPEPTNSGAFEIRPCKMKKNKKTEQDLQQQITIARVILSLFSKYRDK